jgi:hypothetical protein
VPGFADPAHYDSTKSSLSRPGGPASVFGQGGLVDAITGSVEDLQALASGRGGLQNVLGLVQKAGTTYNTFNKPNSGQVIGNDLRNAATSTAKNLVGSAIPIAINAGNAQAFPNAPKIRR